MPTITNPGTIEAIASEYCNNGRNKAEAMISELEPIGRMGEPDEVAEVVVWLCSDSASFVTGHVMPVDGGYIAK